MKKLKMIQNKDGNGEMTYNTEGKQENLCDIEIIILAQSSTDNSSQSTSLMSLGAFSYYMG